MIHENRARKDHENEKNKNTNTKTIVWQMTCRARYCSALVLRRSLRFPTTSQAVMVEMEGEHEQAKTCASRHEAIYVQVTEKRTCVYMTYRT